MKYNKVDLQPNSRIVLMKTLMTFNLFYYVPFEFQCPCCVFSFRSNEA